MLKEIKNKDISELSKTEKAIHGYVLNNIDRINEISSNEIALKLNLDKSLVTRYAKKMGFSGFRELKFFCNDTYKSSSVGYFTNEFIDKQFSKRVVTMINCYFDKADVILLYGEGPSKDVLSVFYTKMLLTFPLKKVILTSDYSIAQKIILEHPNVLMVCLSVKGETKYMHLILDAITMKKGTLIGITDNLNSILSEAANLVLQSQSNCRIPSTSKIDRSNRASALLILETIYEIILNVN